MAEQMAERERDKVIELLLDVSDLIEKDEESHKKKIKPRLCKLAQKPPFKEYGLDENGVKIIAVVFGSFFENEDEDGTKIRDILKKLGGDRKTAFRNMSMIRELKEAGIVEIGKPRARLISGREGDAPEDSTDSFDILRSAVSLSDHFLDSIHDSGRKGKKEAIAPYRDNLEYLADQFLMVDSLMRDAEEFLMVPRRYRRLKGWRDDTGLKMHESRIAERLAMTDKVFPLEEFKRRKSLSREEELIVISLLEKEGRGCDVDIILNIISKSPYERLTNKKLFHKDGRLIREKIIELEAGGGIFNEGDSIKLNDMIKSRLLGEKRKRINLRGADFFEVVKPTASLDKVILHPKTHDEIRLAIEMIQGGVAGRLKEWGIAGSGLLQANTRTKCQPVTMLYYGAPGTGKTLTANAVAYSLKRELVTFDCSKILSMWVGESEKNTRMIFDRYRELSSGMSKPPVLLLNEADQFLHRRTGAEGSANHMYNQMQNIFLEQIERFDGILIATTNLAGNMDPAFSRRFHYKIEFKRPGPGERIKLWRVHIPEKAPLSNDIDLHYLAERYGLSGGQIAVVVRNAATKAAGRGDKICQEDFINACESEMLGNFDEKARAGVGF